MLAAWPTNVYAFFSPHSNIVAILGGTNDCIQGVNPAQAWSNLAAEGTALHNAGAKTIIVTLPSLQNHEVCRDAINTLIYANWSGIFDALADPAANANYGADGAWANLSFFVADGIHPNSTSEQTIIAPAVQSAINTIGTN